jgi:hypothetical protein
MQDVIAAQKTVVQSYNGYSVVYYLFTLAFFFFIPHHILVSYDVPNNAYPKRPLHGGIFLECAIKGGAWGNDAVDTDCMPLDICKL